MVAKNLQDHNHFKNSVVTCSHLPILHNFAGSEFPMLLTRISESELLKNGCWGGPSKICWISGMEEEGVFDTLAPEEAKDTCSFGFLYVFFVI